MLATVTSKARGAVVSVLLALALGVTVAHAAPAPSSPALQSAETKTGTGVENARIVARGRHRNFAHRYHRSHRHYGYRYRPYSYSPYRYVPSCGWRKRCWRDDWGVRHCRWVDTCRRYY